MTKPIVPWDADETFAHIDIVWNSKLDERYLIEVRRTGELTATLLIFDHENDDEELISFDVGLLYGAPFGPDVADVAEWQEKILDFVDNKDKKERTFSMKDLERLILADPDLSEKMSALEDAPKSSVPMPFDKHLARQKKYVEIFCAAAGCSCLDKLLALHEEITRLAQEKTQELLEEILVTPTLFCDGKSMVYHWNQALMDFGAHFLVRGADLSKCPIRDFSAHVPEFLGEKKYYTFSTN